MMISESPERSVEDVNLLRHRVCGVEKCSCVGGQRS
jgi:hypothetical protein